ncbi:acyl-CoA dehydrogenase family protein [Alkalicoccus halolimnae]|uniref:Acyl-CoA dehydrogenase family protein n=1 Tax=Alkalicoccus halolimnae TaxID=1667239 RepID=A0AAJ8LTB2_9BACI|nr:acyl-CoA dehydrogenase family protein [Alkalicoccus halolimnae]
MIEKMHRWLEENEEKLRERGFHHDREGSFPTENFTALQEAGYPGITVPEKYGGMGASLTEFLKLQQRLASADGATALSFGWHAGMIKHVDTYDLWEGDLFEFLCREAVKKEALFNVAATERATGSPTRGGKPQTTAVKQKGKWVLNGRKAFTSMLPVLEYAAVTAVVEDTEEISQFFVPMNEEGISMEETWDSVAMRGTGSHDLVLENVKIPLQNRIVPKQQQVEPVTGWLLHIPACYLGIAEAAFDYAAHFSTTYSPNSLDGTISEVSHVRRKLGELELLYRQNEGMLYYTADLWERASPEERSGMKSQLAAVKHTVTNNGIEMVDLAMRITGARSLSADNPLQRYYRDIRAGLHNPPMDDAVIAMLADEAAKRKRFSE